jgi:hypothetical protein
MASRREQAAAWALVHGMNGSVERFLPVFPGQTGVRVNSESEFVDIMSWIITKYFLTAAVVVLVSELAKRSDKAGSFVAALPLVTVLALIWLYVENQSQQKIANHAWYTFWYVVPTLPMFLAFPVLLARIGFWPALLTGIFITVICFGLFTLVLRPFGIELL